MRHILTAMAATIAMTGAAMAEDPLSGAYATADGFVVTFEGDGVMTVTPPEGEPFKATVTFHGDTLTILDAETDAQDVCADDTGAAIPGVYTYASSDEGLTMTVVEDACEGRVETATAGVWTPTP